MDEASDERVAKALAEENSGSRHARMWNIRMRALDAEIQWATTPTPHCTKKLLCRLLDGHKGICRLVGPEIE